jgi:hypothetical protein
MRGPLPPRYETGVAWRGPGGSEGSGPVPPGKGETRSTTSYHPGAVVALAAAAASLLLALVFAARLAATAFSSKNGEITFVRGTRAARVTGEVYGMGRDGSGRTRFTNNAVFDGLPAFSRRLTNSIYQPPQRPGLRGERRELDHEPQGRRRRRRRGRPGPDHLHQHQERGSTASTTPPQAVRRSTPNPTGALPSTSSAASTSRSTTFPPPTGSRPGAPSS